MNGKTALGAVLVVIGGLMAMNFLGIHLGWIISFLMPFILIGLGVVGVKNDSKVIGGIMIVVGALMLVGKIMGFIGHFFGPLLAIGLVIWGITMFRRQKRA